MLGRMLSAAPSIDCMNANQTHLVQVESQGIACR
jgi:hypothetical protein